MSRFRRSALWSLLLLGCCAVFLALVALPARADDEEKPAVNGKNAKIQLSGVGWVTYRYQLAYADSARTHYAGLASKDMNSFDLDRVYLTGDYAFTDRYSWQTMLEGSNTAGTLRLFIKRAFFKVKDPFGVKGIGARFGQIAHVYTGVVEDVWGNRIVSKVPVDLFLDVSTTYTGVGIDGKVADGMLDFDAAVANQKGYNLASSQKYKSLMGRVTLTPVPKDDNLKGLKLSVFGQMSSRAPKASDYHDLWIAVFPHYKTEKGAVGFEFAQVVDRHGVASTAKTTSRTFSGLGSYEVAPTCRLFARVDRFDPNADAGSTDDGLMSIIGGISHTYTKGVRSLVDVNFTKYDKRATIRGNEIKNSGSNDVILSARMEITL